MKLHHSINQYSHLIGDDSESQCSDESQNSAKRSATSNRQSKKSRQTVSIDSFESQFSLYSDDHQHQQLHFDTEISSQDNAVRYLSHPGMQKSVQLVTESGYPFEHFNDGPLGDLINCWTLMKSAPVSGPKKITCNSDNVQKALKYTADAERGLIVEEMKGRLVNLKGDLGSYYERQFLGEFELTFLDQNVFLIFVVFFRSRLNFANFQHRHHR